METNTNHTATEGAKVAEKLFNDASASIMEAYNKQQNLANGFYSNFFNSFLGNNRGWNGTQGFANNFLNNDLSKLFSSPFGHFGNSFPNPFVITFENIYKQMGEHNHNLLAALRSQIKGNEIDLDAVNKNYQETIVNRLESFKKIFNSLSEACSKKMDFSIETNKKLMEEISTHFSSVIKQNQKFWADALGTFQTPINKEEKKIEESNLIENKKRAGVPVNVSLNHKI
jgi:hypothetical protein